MTDQTQQIPNQNNPNEGQQQNAQPGYQPYAQPQPQPASYQPQPSPNYQPYAQQSPYAQAVNATVMQQPAQYPVSKKDETLRLIAFVFMIIQLACIGWLIIPLAWLIPMSVMIWGTYKGTRPNTVALGACTLLFASLISGILLLVSEKDN